MTLIAPTDRAVTADPGPPHEEARHPVLGAGDAPIPHLADLDRFARWLDDEIARFGDELDERLFLARVDASRPLRLGLDRRGAVIVRGDHPHKDMVEDLFAEDAALAAAYRGIVSARHRLGAHHLNHLFEAEIARAEDDTERDRMRRRFAARFRDLDHTAAQMTFTGGAFRPGSAVCVPVPS